MTAQSNQPISDGIIRPIIQFKALDPDIKPPQRSSELAGGFDLFARESVTIPAGESKLVPVGYSVAIPPGWEGQIWPRSSAAVKHRLETGAGIIDADYRGEIGALILNDSHEDKHIERNTSVAQMSVVPVVTQSELVDELPDTQRGGNAYGSTGNTI